MKLLVTGGNGFAGRFLCEYFGRRDYKVIATYRNNKPKNEIQNVNFVHQDLAEQIDINDKFDAIIHTSCAQPNPTMPMINYIRDNVDVARNLIEYARNNNIKTIIYFSTRSVYGDIRKFEVDESNDIINPDGYGISKYIAEQLFKDANDINTLGIRLPGIIGPGAHDIWLVDIMNKIKNNEDVTINNFESKNFVDIEDISKFIEKMIISSKKGKKFIYPIVNLSCDVSINNLDIANLIKTRLNSTSNIIPKEPMIASSLVSGGLFILNSDHAREMGYESSTPLEIVSGYIENICETEMAEDAEEKCNEV